MRFSLLAVGMSIAVACHSKPDSSATAVTLPSLPSSTVASASASPSARSPATPKRICEATIACGRWSRCAWLDFDHAAPAGYDVYRLSGHDAGGYGSHYWRMHQCYPEDAGSARCARYCNANGVCVDALTNDGVCTVSSPPTPSPYVCEVRGDECVTR